VIKIPGSQMILTFLVKRNWKAIVVKKGRFFRPTQQLNQTLLGPIIQIYLPHLKINKEVIISPICRNNPSFLND
jgi:hypothetical protein